MNRLHLNILRLIGIRKNYEVEFNKGLNYISGPTSTGKTSILEMIDYALGAKKHKSYIEIGEACTDVELEFVILERRYKVRRRLFEFKLPVRIEEWDIEEADYKYLETLEVDVPSNKNSLSSFLMDKLGLADVKAANQFLSFRDIFKYSYLKQTEIDSENIMGEQDWAKNTKRKATFEVIFNVYDEMLADLKASLKVKEGEQNESKIRLEGVEQFIDSTEIGSISKYRKLKKDIENKIVESKSQLQIIKNNDDVDDSNIELFRKNIVTRRAKISSLREAAYEQEDYISKLKLLSNQYQSDINKCEMVLLGYVEINKYEFLVCPNCLKPLSEHNESSKCMLCGNDMSDGISDILKTKKDMQSYKRRHTELGKHILSEENKLERIRGNIRDLEKEIREEENEISHLSEGYLNPHIEQIEFLSYEIGKENRRLEEMDFNLKMLEEHERLQKLLKSKDDDISSIRKNINKLKSEHNDKQEVVRKITKKFNQLLKDFKFPKLDYGYVGEKDYLPYVRNRKYNDLGSLGGVSLIVMAYYIGILETALVEDNNYHLDLLLIDSPRKNLGVDALQEDFRDEEIFNSVIKTFIQLDLNYKDSMQLIVINNGYPDFLPKECLIVEYAADGHKGLIDDVLQ